MDGGAPSLAPRPAYQRGLRPPWRKGETGNPTGWTKERRELALAIEKTQIPKVLEMLDALFARGIEGDDIAAKLWLEQVRGPLKPRPDDAIESAVDQRIMELVSEARRRAGNGQNGGP